MPIMVRHNAIDGSLRMIKAGAFNDVAPQRRYYGAGSIVVILDGIMHERKVRLEEEVTPDMRGTHKVKIDINGVKGKIEIGKLALV
jgi:hypothetical protein